MNQPCWWDDDERKHIFFGEYSQAYFFPHTSSQASAIITSSLLKQIFTTVFMYVFFLPFLLKKSTPTKQTGFKIKSKAIFEEGDDKDEHKSWVFCKIEYTVQILHIFVQGSSKVVLPNYFVLYYFSHTKSVQTELNQSQQPHHYLYFMYYISIAPTLHDMQLDEWCAVVITCNGVNVNTIWQAFRASICNKMNTFLFACSDRVCVKKCHFDTFGLNNSWI